MTLSRYKLRAKDTLLVKPLPLLPFTHIMFFILLPLCSRYAISSIYLSAYVNSNHMSTSLWHEDLYIYITDH